MKIDLSTIMHSLGLPLGLVALFAVLLGLMGMSLEVIVAIAESLVGTFTLIALLINVLKWAGAIDDGWAGRISAIANLVVVGIVAVVFNLSPSFDFAGVDAQIGEFAKVALVIFAYVVQLVGSRMVHKAFKAAAIPLLGSTFSR